MNCNTHNGKDSAMEHDANDDAISVQVDIPTPTEPETPPEPDTTVIVIGTDATDTTDDAIPDPVLTDILARVGALEEGRTVDAARLRELEDAMVSVVNEADTEPEFIEVESEPEPAEPDEPPEETHWLHRPMREWLGRR